MTLPLSSRPLVASLAPIDDPLALERDWRAVESAPGVSFFQSWDWIGSLLEALPVAERPDILRLRAADRVVALALVGRTRGRRRKLIRVRGLHLNETGVPAFDGITMEHNDLVAADGFEQAAMAAAVNYLAHRSDWDELQVGGITTERFLAWQAAAGRAGLWSITRWKSPFHLVDLEAIRATGASYLDSLSPNTRYQVRRAAKAYATRGPLELELASSADQAQAWLARLVELHQIYWTARGKPGAFDTPFKRNFHEALVRRAWPRGTAEILRVATGSREVGYLYNFRKGHTAHNYQSGLVYEQDAKLKPGLVCHALAAQEALSRGICIYDLLMGDSQYKRSLSNASGTMVWGVLQKQRVLLRMESALRAMRDRWRAGPGDVAVDATRPPD